MSTLYLRARDAGERPLFCGNPSASAIPMTRHGKSAVAAPFAVRGSLAYLLVWFLCILVLFGYEEQWDGSVEQMYTMTSLSAVEQVAYVVERYVLSFPSWLPRWFAEVGFGPLAPMVNGALLGCLVGRSVDRRAQAAAEPGAAADASRS